MNLDKKTLYLFDRIDRKINNAPGSERIYWPRGIQLCEIIKNYDLGLDFSMFKNNKNHWVTTVRDKKTEEILIEGKDMRANEKISRLIYERAKVRGLI